MAWKLRNVKVSLLASEAEATGGGGVEWTLGEDSGTELDYQERQPADGAKQGSCRNR